MQPKLNSSNKRDLLLRGGAVLILVGVCAGARLADVTLAAAKPADHWWKGNLHTHSLWSDGDDYPEMIIDGYKKRGYNFLGLSDHNILARGERWIDVAKSKGGTEALRKYRDRFGAKWVEEREKDAAAQVRLRTLEEFRPLFDDPGKFLLLESEEITDKFGAKPIHMNVSNVRDLIRPAGGGSVSEVIQHNVDQVLEQRQRTGQPMFPHINHPNFGWALTAEDMMQVHGERFFEVYNGHPTVHNSGDAARPGMERLWDILLAHRLSGNGEVLYGMAVDDSHNYHSVGAKASNPFRGWVMVRSRSLQANALINAMEAGDFYASNGVTLRDIRRKKQELSIEIEPEEGVTYTTRFIGTRKGFATRSEPVEAKDEKGLPVVASRRYSSDIGQVLAEVPGTSPSYKFRGDELYVRATVVSSKVHPNPSQPGDLETAWVQPVVTGRK